VRSFRYDIGTRAQNAGRTIGRVRSELEKAVAEENEASGLLRQTLAENLGMARSRLDGELTGTKELTLRALADIAWALDREVVIELRRRPAEASGQNAGSETSTIETGRVVFMGGRTASGSTLPSCIRTYSAPHRKPAKKMP
jgi:hypothetical protein